MVRTDGWSVFTYPIMLNRLNYFPVFALTLLVLLSGCDRPFVEPVAPDIEWVSPGLDEVVFSDKVLASVEASSFRQIDRVTVNGQSLTFDGNLGVWSDSLSLVRGLNTLAVDAFDTENVKGTDTVYVFHLPDLQATAGPDLPAPRGAAASVLLEDGSLLITGGAPGWGREAAGTAYLLSPGATEFETLPNGLIHPRAGHSMSLLPDGRVVISGGLIGALPLDDPKFLSGLVEAVEVYDPVAQAFTELDYNGNRPIERAYHTSLNFNLDNGAGVLTDYVYLYAGVGNVGFDDARLGIKNDLRAFVIDDESIEPAGINFDRDAEAIFGHTQTPLTVSANNLGSYLFAGAYFPPESRDERDVDNIIFELRFGSGIDRFNTPVFRTARTFHAAASLDQGQVAFFGGIQWDISDPVGSVEIYSERGGRMYRIPEAKSGLEKRWGHTATFAESSRIRLIGGFDSDGNGISRTEEVSF